LVAAADPLITSGAQSLRKDLIYDFYTHTGLLPTIEITCIKSGYTGNGFANILPGTSEARINIRTVPPQETSIILESVISFIKMNIPNYVQYELFIDDHGDGAILDSDGEIGVSIREKLELVYGKPVLTKHVGGSIPILKDFQTKLGVPVISVSLGNDDCNMHGRDENFKIDLIVKGLEFSELFFRKT
jgi:acetylornithine deacetylase/succinyl-diaminopimelate desuccinylase-like protein